MLLTSVLVAAATAAAAAPDADVLKVFVLAGQSNMEGQAEVNKTCSAAEPGKCSGPGAVMNGTLVYQLSDPRTVGWLPSPPTTAPSSSHPRARMRLT